MLAFRERGLRTAELAVAAMPFLRERLHDRHPPDEAAVEAEDASAEQSEAA